MKFTFNATDSGYIGKALEMAVKNALNRKHSNRVNPAGIADFQYNRKNYEVKQNGTVLRYHEDWGYLRGSNRVIYATHVAHTVTEMTDTTVTVEIDLLNTEFFVLDRKEFLQFLLDNGYAKRNESRGTVNVQTCYNYKKDAYHGRTGKYIEAWAREHEIDDDIISLIYDGVEGL